MVTQIRDPGLCYASVRVVPHYVAVGQQRDLTVQLQGQPGGVTIGVLPVEHHNHSSADLRLPGHSLSALSIGCCWYTVCDGGGGRFYYGGKERSAPVGFGSGDEVSAVVDRHTHSGNGNGNGMVRFLRNGKALMSETERPLPIGFPEEAVFVVSFIWEGRSARIVRFE